MRDFPPILFISVQVFILIERFCFHPSSFFSSLTFTQTEKEELLEEARKAGYLVTKLQQNLNSRDTDIQKLGAGEWPGKHRGESYVNAARRKLNEWKARSTHKAEVVSTELNVTL